MKIYKTDLFFFLKRCSINKLTPRMIRIVVIRVVRLFCFSFSSAFAFFIFSVVLMLFGVDTGKYSQDAMV